MGHSRPGKIPNHHLQLLPVSLTSGAQGILIVYDVTDKESFAAVKTWISEIKKYAQTEVVKILIGNKRDLEDLREVSYEEGKEMAESLDMQFLETSAKETYNIEESFVEMTEKIIDNMGKRGISEEDTPNITQIISKRQTEGRNCC